MVKIVVDQGLWEEQNGGQMDRWIDRKKVVDGRKMEIYVYY